MAARELPPRWPPACWLDGDRLWRLQARVELRDDDGSTIPLVRDVSATGSALPFQRPLVVLVGPGTSSAAEMFAGALQALGRAVLVGEQTAGWLGSAMRVRLAEGWNFAITVAETFLGPELLRLNRIGLTPSVPVVPTIEDEIGGRDPQLQAAIQSLTEGTAVRR